MYISHTREVDSECQSLIEHLEGTANKAKQFGARFNNEEYAYLCGLMHDIGKYSQDFQHKIIKNSSVRVDHSTAGAIEINRSINLFGKLIAYCIAGHHGGLLDGGHKSDSAADTTLNGRLKRVNQLPDYSSFRNEVNFEDFLNIGLPNIKPLNRGGYSLSFFIRMIYSCLVDADFLDTEAFMTNNQVDRSAEEDFKLFYKRLNSFIASFNNTEREINKKRTEILNNCIDKSKLERGLYTLTVPTGGGKTISSLAFAINHALKHGMGRIIYVIPYTSIIEQTARIFKEILGCQNVLEHHSNYDFYNDENSISYKLKLATENWDMPIVVTTNVQLFESLHANKSSKCRKLSTLR